MKVSLSKTLCRPLNVVRSWYDHRQHQHHHCQHHQHQHHQCHRIIRRSFICSGDVNIRICLNTNTNTNTKYYLLRADPHPEKERHVYLTCIVDIYSLHSYLAFISDNYILETSAHRRSQPHTTAHNRSQPLTTAHNRSLLLTTAHYRSQPLTAAHSRSTLTAAHTAAHSQ